jgi:hypothetical protein
VILNRRLILLATPHQIGVLDWRPGRMHWLGEFPHSAQGLADFRQLVIRHAGLPMLLVADTVDEDYRSEALPHVTGRARDELLTRKLKQVFRNARFLGAWRQERETSGRRDDRYLLAAFADADWLTPWLAVLHRERVPLSGITPLALACQHLLEKLRINEPHMLLVFRLSYGLRLSYYQNGLLRFSRLIGGDTPTQLPGSAADDIAKTQLYLTGQRILPREARLHVLLFDPSGQLHSAQAQLNADPAFSARLLDISSLARALRIPDDFLLATPQIAPLAAIAGETLQLNLAPPELLQHHTEFRWRRGLHAAAAGIALLGLGATAAYWLSAQDMNSQAQQSQQQQQQLDRRYRAIAQTFPVQAPAPEQLAQTVTLARRIDARQPGVNTLLAAIAQAWETAPEIVLENLRWSGDVATPGAVRIEIDAALTPFDGNYHAAMQRIERLIRSLEAVPRVHEVSLTNSPVNADSSSTLSGKTLVASPDGEAAARFSLGMVYRETPP